MTIKLKKFNYKEVQQLVSWIPDKDFLLQWAGPSYSMDLLEKQLKNDIDMMSEKNSHNLMFSAKLKVLLESVEK